MHTLMLVAGDNVDDQLLPYSVHVEVEPHEVFLSDDDTKRMARHYGIPPTDLHTLASKMRDWEEEDGVVRDGRLARISRHNPNGRCD